MSCRMKEPSLYILTCPAIVSSTAAYEKHILLQPKDLAYVAVGYMCGMNHSCICPHHQTFFLLPTCMGRVRSDAYSRSSPGRRRFLHIDDDGFIVAIEAEEGDGELDAKRVEDDEGEAGNEGGGGLECGPLAEEP